MYWQNAAASYGLACYFTPSLSFFTFFLSLCISPFLYIFLLSQSVSLAILLFSHSICSLFPTYSLHILFLCILSKYFHSISSLLVRLFISLCILISSYSSFISFHVLSLSSKQHFKVLSIILNAKKEKLGISREKLEKNQSKHLLQMSVFFARGQAALRSGGNPI